MTDIDQNQTSAAEMDDRSGFVSSKGLGPLTRNRPARPPLIPRALLWTVVAVVGAALLGVGVFLVYTNTARVETPRVLGLDADLARTRLAAENIDLVIAGERFSSEPKGQVLEQTPEPGEPLRKGQVLRVVVSAGTEEFAMPDVVNSGLQLAMGKLQALGLQVRIDRQVSEDTSDVVLATTPAPGVTVRSGDTVRLTVSSKGSSTNTLLPYDLSRVTVIIDPAPIATGQTDAPAEVARRLRSLLEASGAAVVMTRSGTPTAPITPESRKQAATESSATVAIGLEVATTGAGGIILGRPAAGGPSVTGTTSRLSGLIADELEANSVTSKQVGAASDAIFTGLDVPWIRVRLGSFSARDDVVTFRDPQWSDVVARDLYRALGEVFGVKGGDS